eukprot:GHVT01017263.1.p1 GENE.GHVT01017263.1~~GHVT01017263.1.p1  ORF type:complete len:138 (-),score=20.08 GHVT01017263.1:67-480(-)
MRVDLPHEVALQCQSAAVTSSRRASKSSWSTVAAPLCACKMRSAADVAFFSTFRPLLRGADFFLEPEDAAGGELPPTSGSGLGQRSTPPATLETPSPELPPACARTETQRTNITSPKASGRLGPPRLNYKSKMLVSI